MRKIKLTESELIRLVQQIVSEQPTIANLNAQRQAGNQATIQKGGTRYSAPGTFAPKPPLNTGSYTPMRSQQAMRSDFEKSASQHQRQPSSLTMLQPGQTLTLGEKLFETGKDWINKNSQEFKNAIGVLVNLPQGTTIKVTGGASAVGSSRGYDNKALALRRANNMIAALKGTGKVNQLTFVPEGVVGKNTQYNSPGEKAEQFVKLTREQKTNVAISRPAIDNTHYGNPNSTYQDVLKYPGYTLPSDNPNKGTLKGVRDPNYFKPKLNEDKIKEVVKQNLLEFFGSREFSKRADFSKVTPLTPYKPSMMDRFKLGVKKVFGTENEKHRKLFNELLLKLTDPDNAWNVVKVGEDAMADTVIGKLFVSCNPQSPQLSLSRQGKMIEFELENKAEACQEVYDALHKPKLSEDKFKEVVKQNLLEFFDSHEFSGRAGFSRGTPLTFGEKFKRAMEKCFGQIGSESSLPDETPLSDSPFCKKLRDIRKDIELGGMFIDDI